jgi:O-antigen/teichoic acid export membrane protein
MEFEAVINVCERVGLIAAAIHVWATIPDLELLIILFASVQFLKSGLAYFLIRKNFLLIQPKLDFKKAYAILKESYPFALTGVFFTISSRIDIIMLKFFHSDSAAGIYSVARKLIESLFFIPENVAYALFPALSVLYVSQKELFRKTFQRSFHYLMLIAIPVVIIIFFLSPHIVNLLFEPEFARASIALRWLVISLGIMFLNYLFIATLSSIGKQHLISLYTGLAMIINVILNYALIPKFEIVGACMATVLSETITVILVIVTIKKLIQLPKFSFTNLKALFSGALIAVFIYLFGNWNLILVIILSGLIYLFLLVILKVLSKEDMEQLAQYIRSKISHKKDVG